MPQFKSEPRARADALPVVLLMTLLAALPRGAVAVDPVMAPEASAAGVEDTATRGLERYQEARAAHFIDWLADGSLLIATRFGDTRQIHRLRAPLGMREQLSFEHGEVLGATARPYGGDAFVYQSSADGGRTSSLHLLRLADHSVADLTHGGFRDDLPLFAHDGQRIAFSSNRAGNADRAIYVLDTGDPAPSPRLVAGSAGERWRVFGWSADDSQLLVGREDTGAQGFELAFADLQTGAVTPLQLPAAAGARARRAEPPRALRARDARIAPDGHGLLVLGYQDQSGVPAQFLSLRYVDPGSGESHELLAGTMHDIELFDASADDRYLAYTVNDEGVSRLMLVDRKAKLESVVGDVPVGIIHSLKFDPEGTHLALSVEGALAPEDVYVYAPATQTLTRWSAGERGLVDPAALVAPQLRHFPTWDRVEGQPRMLSAFVYGAGAPLAPGAPPRPVLIVLRGAQGGQFRPGYDPFLQYLVNVLRFVVVAPNVRGAAGYGRDFSALGDGALRADAARDVGSLLAWLGLQEGLDRERVVVMGEGGPDDLALAALAQYGDRLQGAIAAGPPVVPPLPSPVTIRRPVLLAAVMPPAAVPEDPAVAVPNDPFAILAFRLRSTGASARYLRFSGDLSGGERSSARDAYERAVADFLAQLLR
jgi:hypothetical protein